VLAATRRRRELKRRCLGYVRDIAENGLDWNKLGPIAEKHHALIAHDVKIDTRKLDSNQAFQQSLRGTFEAEGVHGSERGVSLKEFADQRREYLLNHPALQGLSSRVRRRDHVAADAARADEEEVDFVPVHGEVLAIPCIQGAPRGSCVTEADRR
jgi:hypothetical protein